MMKVDILSVEEDLNYYHLSFKKGDIILGRKCNRGDKYMIRDKNNEWNIVEDYRMTIIASFPFEKIKSRGYYLLNKKQLIKDLPTYRFMNDLTNIKIY